jgi:LPS-assembly protein
MRPPLPVLALLAGLLLAGLPGGRAEGQAPRPLTVPTAGGEVTVVADRIEQLGPENLLIATGNVEIVRGAARLTADRVEINRDTGDAVAEGRVVFYDGANQLTGARLEYNLRTGTGVVHDAYARAEPYYRLRGERMERVAESVYQVREGMFTTCEDDPPTWSFRFDRATADLEDFVWGTGASFWVKRLPLLPFFPLFAAPIRRERQTGFLFPRVGSSSSRGFHAEQPFFWAISESQDLTVAPIVFTERGVGGRIEYRYILSEAQRGSARAFYLAETERNGADRGLAGVRHAWQIAPGVSLNVDANGVTDDNVLRDYDDELFRRGAQRVESNVFLTGRSDAWVGVANLYAYQDLTTRRPNELYRLPDLSLLGVRQPVPGVPGLLFELDAGYVNFVRDVGSDGSRADLRPRLSYPLSPGGLFTLTPFVGARLTAYDKTVVGTHVTPVGDDVEVTRDEPRVRRLLEAGADLEATASRVYRLDGRWGLDAALHTIEPRVTYTWITGADQTRLPLWAESVDRVPETSRVEYSLINRVRARTVAPEGTEAVRLEVLRLLLGHSWDVRRADPGLIVGDLILQPATFLRLRTDVGWDVREGLATTNSDVAVLLPRVTASVGTRYSEPARVNFLQAEARAELTRILTARASTNLDIRTETLVEQRVAADVKFQCWALTVEYIRRERRDDEVRFAVNLLGIGGPIRTSVGLGALGATGQR